MICYVTIVCHIVVSIVRYIMLSDLCLSEWDCISKLNSKIYTKIDPRSLSFATVGKNLDSRPIKTVNLRRVKYLYQKVFRIRKD